MHYLNKKPRLHSLNKVAYCFEKMNTKENSLMNELVVCNRLLLQRSGAFLTLTLWTVEKPVVTFSFSVGLIIVPVLHLLFFI